MQEEMRRYGDRMLTQGQTPLQVRVGANTGEVVVRSIQTGADHAEYTPIGHSTGLAARLQTLAKPGTTMISESTRRLVEGFFQLKSFGSTRLKGVTGEVEVYEVTGLGPLRTRLQRAAARGLTKFVGRQREMDALKHAAEQAQAGHGQMVAVMADPGVGKSRLFYEFKATSQSGWIVLEAFSVSHGKASAYLPVLELLSRYFEISHDDDDRKRRKRVFGKVLELGRTLEDALPYLYSLLGIVEGDDPLLQMEAQLKKRRTLEAIKRILLCESLNQPLMLILEDLHWIDEQTQELLNLLADSIGTSRILLLVNYRPEYRHDWNQKTYYTQLRLDPLRAAGAGEMLAALLGDDHQLVPLRRLVIERTEGNPFFMEEIVQALLEEGVLARNGSISLVKPLNEVKLPPTVQGVVASRIDRLQPAHKELLQTISIIGREFPLALVRRLVAKPDDELGQALAELQLAEFIYEQPAVGDIEYIFKHALTQEVAYGSVLIKRRREAHEQVAQAIEALYENQVDEHLSELAYHYRRSDNSFKAVDYLKRAAQQAAGRSAVSEAESQIREALAILVAGPATPDRDPRELELQTALCTLLVSRSFAAPEREDPLRRAYELCERLGDQRETLSVLFQLGQFYIMRARYSEARQLTERALTLASSVGELILAAGVHENLAECNFWTGDLPRAMVYFERTVAECEKTSAPALIRVYGFDLLVISAGFLSLVELLIGRPDLAIEWERRVIERARSSSHPYSHAFGLQMAAVPRWARRDIKGTSEILIRARQICEEYGFHEIGGLVKQMDGWARFWQGERAFGIAEINQAIEDLNAVGSLSLTPWRLAGLAEMELESGEIGAAEVHLKEELEALNSTQESWYEPEVYRIAAKLMVQRPEIDPIAVEEYLLRAIEIARVQGAKWWELRSSVSLAGLLRDTDRRDKARTMLGEIYTCFTEGFELPDLKEAKKLLEELNG
jgi:tetratricopeptide (TPR) repeat protein